MTKRERRKKKKTFAKKSIEKKKRIQSFKSNLPILFSLISQEVEVMNENIIRITSHYWKLGKIFVLKLRLLHEQTDLQVIHNSFSKNNLEKGYIQKEILRQIKKMIWLNAKREEKQKNNFCPKTIEN